MGRLISAGIGVEWYRHVRIPADEPPAPPQPSEDDMDLDREAMPVYFNGRCFSGSAVDHALCLMTGPVGTQEPTHGHGGSGRALPIAV